MKVDTTDYVKKLRLQIDKDMRNIPSFLDSVSDKLTFDNMVSILNIIKKTTSNKFLSLDEIDWQIAAINIYERKIIDIQDDEVKRLCVFLYLSRLLENYMDFAKDNELYECCASYKHIKQSGF